MTPAHPRAARGRDRGPAGPARRHRRPAHPEAGREGTGQGPDQPHHADDVRRVRRRRDPRRWPRLVARSAMSSQSTQGIDRTEPTTPDPDDPRKPDAPTDLEKRTWWYVATQGAARVRRRPVHRPGRGADLLRRAGHLPGRARPQRDPRSRRPVGEVGADGPRRDQPPRLRGCPRHHRAHAARARLSQTAGLGAAPRCACWRLWSASGYVGAFGRAMNRIYEIGEGRPVLEAAARDAPRHAGRDRAGRAGAADAGRLGTAGPVDRRPDRPGRPGRPGLEHREVAGHGCSP